MGRMVTGTLAVLACVMLVPAPASAQLGNSGIAGRVGDTSGAVLPGVTVEAASPALIEKVRTVVTDGQGQYSITNLRPGTYTVTFTLTGFSPFIRERLELPSNFTASLNVALGLGTVQETVTVSGESPVVDVQNLTQQQRMSQEDLNKIPTSKTLFDLTNLMPAVVSAPALRGVGGNQGEMDASVSLHGGRQGDQKALQDGMRFTIGVDARIAYYINPEAAQEIVVEGPAGGSAEYSTGGVQINTIPKDGGNRFTGSFLTNYTNGRLHSDNLTQELRDRGLVAAPAVDSIHDINFAVGGPIRRDRLWFFTAHRYWGNLVTNLNYFQNALRGTWLYAPDTSRPVASRQVNRSNNIRLTGQVSQKNKVTFSYDHEPNCACPGSETENLAPEALGDVTRSPNDLWQATWTLVATSRMLFEAGATTYQSRRYGNMPSARLVAPVSKDTISVVEQTTGFRYNSPAATTFQNPSQWNGRASMSYVTGSHAFKTGLLWTWAPQENRSTPNPSSVTYTFRNGSPASITEFASPTNTRQEAKEVGLYVQDKWTRKRLTINAGLRFDALSAAIPAREQPAGVFIGARQFARVDNVPNWKDLEPRLGFSYDLFGTGKTAVKASVGKYVAFVNPVGTYNPVTTSVNNVTRTWNDNNRDFFPDCNLQDPLPNGECLQINNLNFGKPNIVTRGDPALLQGWGKRGANWQAVAMVQHEISQGFSVSAGYYRTSYRNFSVTDNLAVTKEDFDSYCITAPANPGLPSGGGYRICGLYNINPLKFGLVNNLNTLASKYGKWTEVYNGADFNVTARPPGGALVTGGLSIGDSGTTVASASTGSSSTVSATNRCFVVDSPQELYQCKFRPPYQMQLKFGGSYPLPWDLVASANLQSTPGAVIDATYTATSAEIAQSLNRPTAGGGNVGGIQLLAPFSKFEHRINTLDLRFSKQFPAGRVRVQGLLDVYNALNASTVLWTNATYGPNWPSPAKILTGRLLKFGVKMDF